MTWFLKQTIEEMVRFQSSGNNTDVHCYIFTNKQKTFCLRCQKYTSSGRCLFPPTAPTKCSSFKEKYLGPSSSSQPPSKLWNMEGIQKNGSA